MPLSYEGVAFSAIRWRENLALQREFPGRAADLRSRGGRGAVAAPVRAPFARRPRPGSRVDSRPDALS